MAESQPKPKKNIQLAVITGQHPFNVPAFHVLFRSLKDADFYPQDLETFVADEGDARRGYDVLLFYNFHQIVPGDDQNWWAKSVRQALEQLGETDQGICVLHHATLAFLQWPLWSEICGIADRRFNYYHDQQVHVEVANPEHPITRGLTDWDMDDETYTMNDAGEGSEILLTTRHPKSLHTLAWTRQYRQARVFCCTLGHDAPAFVNPNFRAVVGQSIQWLAGRI